LRGFSTSRVFAGTINEGTAFDSQKQQQQQQQLRYKSSTTKKKFKGGRRPPKGGYYSRLDKNRALENSIKKKKGPREPNDISTPLPKITKSQIQIKDALDADEEDDLTPLGTLVGGALRALRAESSMATAADDSIEAKLRTMDFFTSADGSTEDLVGARRAVAAETYGDQDADELLARIDELVDAERFEYMELPSSADFSTGALSGDSEAAASSSSGGASDHIPRNQLAHGDW
jgi:hypothetical protein